MVSHRVPQELPRIASNRAGFLFVLPALLFFGSVFLLPLAQSIMYSFYKIAPGGAKEFVGLRLYEKVLTDSTSGPPSGTRSSSCSSPCPPRWFSRSPWRSVSTGSAISSGATSGRRCTSCPSPPRWSRPRSIWQWIYDPVYGFLNYALSFVGIPPQKWLQSLSQVLPAIAAVSVWVRIGFDTMIFLAALQSIPEEYYEAARHRRRQCASSGCGTSRCRCSTPQIIMVCILELIFNFKIFDQVYATTQGGPAGASQTIIMLLYDTAFKFFRFGDASVMAVFVFVTLMVVTLLQWRLFRKPVEY